MRWRSGEAPEPVETQQQLKTTVPGVQIVTMPGLGHYPSQEEPEAFTRIAREFLASVR